jgi:hypothetical protein
MYIIQQLHQPSRVTIFVKTNIVELDGGSANLITIKWFTILLILWKLRNCSSFRRSASNRIMVKSLI